MAWPKACRLLVLVPAAARMSSPVSTSASATHHGARAVPALNVRRSGPADKPVGVKRTRGLIVVDREFAAGPTHRKPLYDARRHATLYQTQLARLLGPGRGSGERARQARRLMALFRPLDKC
jgi:hypothetical protein